MNLETARHNMIEQQIRTWHVLDQDVLELLQIVHREAFVPAAYASLAFVDTEIPLPCGASMLQPKLEARILQSLAIKKHENVLEIGTGSGYMAALLSFRARRVVTVEIEPELQALAQRNLADYGIDNVQVELGDGSQGWGGSAGEDAQYDVIVLSGSLEILPPQFLQQLKPGGRLFVVTGYLPIMEAQLVTRTGEHDFQTSALFETVIPPLRNACPPTHFRF